VIPNLTVPVLNRYDLLERMVRSIDYPIDHLLIIDNGGHLGQLVKPVIINKMTVLKMPSNLGVASSWNLGVKSFPYSPAWFFSSADTVYTKGALEVLAQAKPTDITLSDSFPFWQTFAIGEEVVRRIGLFDEGLHPIYFEDTDYERRANHAGIDIVKLPVEVLHDNSSTIRSSDTYNLRNNFTYAANAGYFRDKQKRFDFGAGQWSLDIRRANGWEG
jgi:GT2 family glycosyltransferase